MSAVLEFTSHTYVREVRAKELFPNVLHRKHLSSTSPRGWNANARVASGCTPMSHTSNTNTRPHTQTHTHTHPRARSASAQVEHVHETLQEFVFVYGCDFVGGTQRHMDRAHEQVQPFILSCIVWDVSYGVI